MSMPRSRRRRHAPTPNRRPRRWRWSNDDHATGNKTLCCGGAATLGTETTQLKPHGALSRGLFRPRPVAAPIAC